MDELGISNDRLAEAIGVAPATIEKIVGCQSPITGNIALRIGKAFRMSPESWLGLQNLYDLDVARQSTDNSNIDPLIPPPRWEGNVMV